MAHVAVVGARGGGRDREPPSVEKAARQLGVHQLRPQQAEAIAEKAGDSEATDEADDKTVVPLWLLKQSNDEQMQAFRPVPAGERKVVLATNIAETSITIEDVTIVIDSGKEKTKRFDPVSRSFSLMPGWISKTSAVQRIGRAGRVREGVCIHLVTSTRFDCHVRLFR